MTPKNNHTNKPKRGRFAQSDREALVTLGLYAAYFLWWYLFAYGLGGGDPAEYSYVLGFPTWFFYSCVLGCPLFGILVWIVVRLFFRDMPLDAYLPDENAPASGHPQSTPTATPPHNPASGPRSSGSTTTAPETECQAKAASPSESTSLTNAASESGSTVRPESKNPEDR